VAAGVFGPGHLGELTQIVPFGLADAVLEEAGATERRLRLLPSRVGLYFVLGMVLFPGTGYRGVWAKLTDALDAVCPDLKALRDLRRRIGAAPLKALFEVLAGPLAWPRTPGVMFGRYRTVAFDGCRSIRVPGSERNRGWLGKLKAALGETGYPAIQLMTLCETGTRALIGAVFGSPADGETTWARKLLHLLDATMLVLMDRGFDGADFLAEVAAAKAQFLVRLTATRRPPVLRYFPDGSFLPVIGGVKVRIIPADVIVTCHDGTVYGDRYRLATTILDWRAYPATGAVCPGERAASPGEHVLAVRCLRLLRLGRGGELSWALPPSSTAALTGLPTPSWRSAQPACRPTTPGSSSYPSWALQGQRRPRCCWIRSCSGLPRRTSGKRGRAGRFRCSAPVPTSCSPSL